MLRLAGCWADQSPVQQGWQHWSPPAGEARSTKGCMGSGGDCQSGPFGQLLQQGWGFQVSCKIEQTSQRAIFRTSSRRHHRLYFDAALWKGWPGVRGVHHAQRGWSSSNSSQKRWPAVCLPVQRASHPHTGSFWKWIFEPTLHVRSCYQSLASWNANSDPRWRMPPT